MPNLIPFYLSNALWGHFSVGWSLTSRCREVKYLPKITKLVRIQTRSHLAPESVLLTDVLVILIIFWIEDFSRKLMKNIDIHTSFPEFLLQPIWAGLRSQHFNSPILGILRQVEHSLQCTVF